MADYANYWYDLFIDWDLIEASFAQQYGIRLTATELSWAEFTRLLSGLLPDTPLGKIVAIRAETDSKVLKSFTKEQKRIRSEWMLHKNETIKSDKKAYQSKYERLQELCRAAFSQ